MMFGKRERKPHDWRVADAVLPGVADAVLIFTKFDYSKFQIPDSGFQIRNSQRQIADSKLQIQNCRFKIAGFGMQIPDCTFGISDYSCGLTITDSGFLIPDLWIPNSKYQNPKFQIPNTKYQ